MLRNSWYLAGMLSRISVAVACDGLRLVMDITKVEVPRSLQSLVIVTALTMRMSIFLPLAGSFFRFFGSLNMILVSVQSMFGLCWASHLEHRTRWVAYSFNWLGSTGPVGSSEANVSEGVSAGRVAACPFADAVGHFAIV